MQGNASKFWITLSFQQFCSGNYDVRWIIKNHKSVVAVKHITTFVIIVCAWRSYLYAETLVYILPSFKLHILYVLNFLFYFSKVKWTFLFCLFLCFLFQNSVSDFEVPKLYIFIFSAKKIFLFQCAFYQCIYYHFSQGSRSCWFYKWEVLQDFSVLYLKILHER